MAQLSLFDAPNRMLASVSPQHAWLRRYGWKRPNIALFDPPTHRPKLPLESRSRRWLYLLDAAIPLVPSVCHIFLGCVSIIVPVDHKNSHNRIFARHTNFEIRIFDFPPGIGIFEKCIFE